MKHEHFIELLRHAFVGHGATDKDDAVRVQWDPERTPANQKLSWRSIQIGIPKSLSQRWVEEMIVSIEDVTERAKALKKVVDEQPNIHLEELIAKEVVPVERPFEVPEDIRKILKMDEPEGWWREQPKEAQLAREAKRDA
jgi:hypothetical protein